MVNVSIIIKAYNEEKYIAKCIESALKALKKVPGKNEIILVDSLSQDRTVEIAKRYPIRIIQLKPNWQKSAAAALETGYRHSKGKYVYALDGDMTLDENFISIALNKLKKNESVAGIGGNMQIPKNKFFLNKRAKRHLKIYKNHIDYFNAYSLPGGGLYKKSAIEEVGYLANPYLFSDEEADLGFRLEKKRYRLMRLDCPSVRHYGYSAPPIEFVFSKFKSKYFQGTGQILRNYFGEKIFWKHLIKEQMRILAILWWLLFFISIFSLIIGPIIFYAYLILSSLLFLFIVLRKKSITDSLYSIVSWTLAGISIIIGFMGKPKNPLSYPRDAIVIK